MGKEKQVSGTALDTWTTTDKGLRRVMLNKWMDPYVPYDITTRGGIEQHNPTIIAGQYLSELTPGVDDDKYAQYMRENSALGWDFYEENAYIKDHILKNEIIELVRLQKIAALEQIHKDDPNFDGINYKKALADPRNTWQWDKVQQSWSYTYNDFDKDFHNFRSFSMSLETA